MSRGRIGGGRAARYDDDVGIVSWFLTKLIGLYQLVFRPILPPACRYFPTCSDYALEAIKKHGPGRGSLLAAKRICRCHPWGGHGYDPVP